MKAKTFIKGENITNKNTDGKIYGIGLGPGDKELITLKAVRALGEIDVVCYVKPKSGFLRAYNIAAEHLRDDVEHLAFEYDIGSKVTKHNEVYKNIASKIEEQGAIGKKIGILCEGDCLLYGSFIYIFENLQNKENVIIIPGVNSINAGAASLKLPISQKEEIVSIIPAFNDEEVIVEILKNSQRVIFIKIAGHYKKIIKILSNYNLLDNAYFISEIGAESEMQKKLKDCDDEDFKYFSIIYVKGIN